MPASKANMAAMATPMLNAFTKGHPISSAGGWGHIASRVTMDWIFAGQRFTTAKQVTEVIGDPATATVFARRRSL
jgi:hypothetical protein